MGTKEVKAVPAVAGKDTKSDVAPMDIRKISSLWNWSATVDGQSIGGPYQLPMVVRQLEQKKIKNATITFDYKA